MSRKHNFEMFRGADKVLSVTVDNGADPPVAVDISTWTLAFTVRLTAQSTAEALIEKTSTSGITLSDPTHGVFQVALADTDTAGLAPGKYAYDCKRMSEGAEDVLVYGTMTLLPEVTR